MKSGHSYTCDVTHDGRTLKGRGEQRTRGRETSPVNSGRGMASTAHSTWETIFRYEAGYPTGPLVCMRWGSPEIHRPMKDPMAA
jgi:hypothetical protein